MSAISLVPFSADCCVLCSKHLAGSTEEIAKVHSKGLETLIQYSSLHQNEALQVYLQSHPDVVRVHVRCRKDYTRLRARSYSETDESARNPPKKLRSQCDVFAWQKDCFFCAKPAVLDDRHPEKNANIHFARTLQIRDNVLALCDKRMDPWSLQVKGRLQLSIDLPASDAVYHESCYKNFYFGRKHPDADLNETGRPEDSHKVESFMKMCDWFESCDKLCSVHDLRQRMLEECCNDDNLVYSLQSLKRKLLERYGDHVFFAEVQGHRDVVCLKNMASFIINAKWYAERKEDLAQESQRIIVAAAKLIRAQIHEAKYTTDYYPTVQEIGDRNICKAWVPPSLKLFMETLISDEVKQIAISHSIVQTCRPRSVISPVLLGLGIQLDHLYRSKYLVTELSRLGMCISYDEITRFKQSVICDNQNGFNIEPYPGSFTQWVADNVDHNTKTLDGLGTFHGMGIIAATTSISKHKAHAKEDPIKRVKKTSGKDVVKQCGIPIQFYSQPQKSALSSVIFRPAKQLQSVYTLPPSCNLDLLWYSCWLVQDSSSMQTNWSGFQQHVNIGPHPQIADIKMMPIIDMNSSDDHCIYSTLKFVQQQAKSLGIVTPCVTFDQPLWLKAFEIVRSTDMNVVCRLGGFHTLMSFLGSIGTLMGGSGLTDALETCYGPNAVIHMMSGKAIARALRGHFLVDAALTLRIIKLVSLDGISTGFEDVTYENSMHRGIETMQPSDIQDLNILLTHIVENPESNYEHLDFKAIMKLDRAVCEMKSNLSSSRTAKLWVLYMEQIATVKMFIRAERTGNWNLHLIAMTRMLNLFAATGHNNYAKSARLYLQVMFELPSSHPWLFEQFTKNGFHVIRRSDRYWAGLWTDLVIEQTMMRAVKSRGGLTHGSGMTETVRHTWIKTLHKCASVHEAMAQVSGLENQTRDQHFELGKMRARRDVTDLRKIMDWLDIHDPFNQNDSALRCISSGLTAKKEDGINCDMADEVGRRIQVSMDDKCFSETVLKKKAQVRTLLHLQKAVVINHGKKLYLSSTHLFTRLIVLVERTTEMSPFFAYELTPLPSSLFKHSFLRKPDKAALGKMLFKNARHTGPVSSPCYVLDGGSLLHKVSWPKIGKYSDILDMYARYVDKNYSANCWIVFDGYNHGPSTKDHEHERRSRTSGAAPDIEVKLDNPVYKRQEAFLGNGHNKAQLIDALTRRLRQQNHEVLQAVNDADTHIVKVAIDLARNGKVVIVVGEDTDVLVLLVYHYEASMKDIYMLSSEGVKKGPRLVSIRDIQMDIGASVVKQLLVIHALTGCDTTSALYNQGKVSAFRKIKGSKDAVTLTDIMSDDYQTQQQIHDAGCQLLSLMYSGKISQKLNALRYSTYMTMCASSSARPIPERLPPTERAAHFHCLRVHYQVLQWKSLNESIHINPVDWGWTLLEGKLQPFPTDLAPAPEDLLKVIRCSCKSASSSQCSSNACTCKKNGLRCVAACGGCHGDGCMNSEHMEISDNAVCIEPTNDACVETVDIDEDICFHDDHLQWMGMEEDVY